MASDRSIWQIAAGDGGRDYHDLFLDFGIACVGPGDPGDYFEHRTEYDERDSAAFRPFMRPFCEQLRPGHLLALKRPAGQRWEVVAVGEVDSEYHYEERLADVEGWDLQHVRRVRWRKPVERAVVPGLRRGTLTRVGNSDTRSRIEALWESSPAVTSTDLPEAAQPLEIEDLISLLLDTGLPVAQAETISSTIWRLRRLARWYRRHGTDIGEHEIRSFLIVPLLLALGWPEQRIKIEWNSLDLALFRDPYVKGAGPTLIVESKRLYDALGVLSEDQALRYATRYDECEAIVISDGFRYKLMRPQGDGWAPAAYANLLMLRDRHPYRVEIDGAGALFQQLLP